MLRCDSPATIPNNNPRRVLTAVCLQPNDSGDCEFARARVLHLDAAGQRRCYLPYAGDLAQACIPLASYGVLSTAPVAKSRGGAGACRHRDSVSLSRRTGERVVCCIRCTVTGTTPQPDGLRFANQVLPEYRERFCEVFVKIVGE